MNRLAAADKPTDESRPSRAPVWPCELIAAMAGDDLLGLFVVTPNGRHLKFQELETWLAARKERAS